MTDTLTTIIEAKHIEVTNAKKNIPLNVLREKLEQAPQIRDFIGAINHQLTNGKLAVIAEIKKASPSKGIIRADFDPVEIARSYAKAGATCLSVLTDIPYFQGSPLYLQQARSACSLPILRKDFIIDAYQIYESRLIGADCILLIVAALNDIQLRKFSGLAAELGMAVLVETHNTEEVDRALALPCKLIGINNRNLHSYVIDLNTTITLHKKIPADRILVTESGINTQQDVALMRSHGVHTFLVGETFMRAPDPGEKLKEIFQ